MTTASTPQANAEQITFWNDVGGPKWVRFQEMLDRQLDSVGALAMDAAAIEAGNSVLDVGCGCGSTTLALARRAGPAGHATGIDISRPMLALARERASAAGLTNVTFEEADAQTHRFRPDYDVMYSRFGVMFFDDPARAFTNLHGGLRSGGRMSFVCWQALHRNPWMGVPMMAAMKHVTIEMPASPEAPGPFAFADGARLERILAEGGFRDIHVRGQDIDLTLAGGADPAQTVDLLLELGPLGRVLADKPPELRQTVAREVLDAVIGYARSDGVTMPGAIWIVTARA